MGIFDFFKNNSRGEKDIFNGETPPCPMCGNPLTKKYIYSEMYCENCGYGLEDDDDENGEPISVYDAAQIWASHGKDEDYTFGYSIEDLEDAL